MPVSFPSLFTCYGVLLYNSLGYYFLFLTCNNAVIETIPASFLSFFLFLKKKIKYMYKLELFRQFKLTFCR
ncbi:MAG: hypothetical protein EXX96DRAFT_553102 [Benjaminiella poitrasii]|nr:MAG: hypothetical protein EXX96DRAFT_553102 [Benjaminiella poitrasii]